MTRFAVALHAVIFVFLVPMLEVGDTHLLNLDWPAHARLHETWQLLTNASLSAFALLLAWRWKRPLSALATCLIVSSSFLAAWAAQGAYGGSMRHSDGSELAVFGVNAAGLVMLAVVCVLLASLAKEVLAFRSEQPT